MLQKCGVSHFCSNNFGSGIWTYIGCGQNSFWVWVLIQLNVGFPKKIGSRTSSFDSKYFLSQGKLTWKMLKKVVFCITDLWTEHIKKFESEANHFVPNVLSVKNTQWNPCMTFLPDPLFNDNMAHHVFFVEEISKKVGSLFILRCLNFERRRKTKTTWTVETNFSTEK